MSMKSVLEAFQKYEKFLICTHINPDPDALASQVALGIYLEQKGKTVFLISEETVPERFLFLPGMKKIKALGTKRRLDYDAVIVTDCGDLDRIGAVKCLLKEGLPIINIDHHITNTRFGDMNYIVTDSSSTCEVIFWLLKKAKAELTFELAQLLYVGVVTDTGSFRYTNTSGKTHRMASMLMEEHLIEANTLYQRIYEQVPLNDLKYFTLLVSDFESLYDGKLICVKLPRNIVKKFSEQFDLRDKIFGYLRTIQGVEVLAIFTEEKPNITRVNMRSQGDVDVARIAARFQGGGHSKASGCLVAGNMKEAHRKVLPQIKKALKAL